MTITLKNCFEQRKLEKKSSYMCLHTLIQAKGLIRKSMARSIIMLNIIVENEENCFFNISISFPRSWSLY